MKRENKAGEAEKVKAEEGEQEKEEEKREKIKEIIAKYNIDLKKLEEEQTRLAKQLVLKDALKLDEIDRIAGIDSIFLGNKIISVVVVLDKNMELVEQKYFSDKIRFPYIPGFRAYRELPSMISAFNLLEDKPDIVFINGHGIAHPRLGLASHFSLVVNVPAIGVADSLFIGEVKDEKILLDGKIVGVVLQTKQGARPLYVSPGNSISLRIAVEIVKKCVKEPHKFPEPLRIAKKYVKEVMKEMFKTVGKQEDKKKDNEEN